MTGKDISHQYVNLRECPALRELRADAPGGSYLASEQVHRPDGSLGLRCQCHKLPVSAIPCSPSRNRHCSTWAAMDSCRSNGRSCGRL